ncbi:unnamed protein product [Symbiodinium sp. CCMP2592]|nr:unnamed protein product [Symbiodinium sp. CCMP2592]
MPTSKRVVDEAVAKAKQRQAKIRKMMETKESPVLEPYHDLIAFNRPNPDTQETQIDESLMQAGLDVLRSRTTATQPNSEGEQPQAENMKEAPEPSALEASKPDAVPDPKATQQGEIPQEQQEGNKPKDPNAGSSWPDSWANATSWDSWGNNRWSQWSWGGGWDSSQHDWNYKDLSEDHLSWRRRHSSIDSLSDAQASPQAWHRAWSQESYKSSSSLQSELIAGFQRLNTIDRTHDKDLAKVAANLEKKFEAAKSPDKSGIPTPTTATPQGSPSPSSSQQSSPAPEKAPQDASEKPQDKTKVSKEQSEQKQPDGTEKTTADQKDTDKGKQEDETEEGKAAKKAAAAAERKKKAHARYMRYFRSVHGGDLNSEKNSVMFEAWLNCGGNWKQSQLYINCKTKNISKRKGVRKWMLRTDIEAKFGVENAEAIIVRKLNDEKLRDTEVKKHPDLPESLDMMQFLIFDSEEEIEQEEEVMEMLYKLAEEEEADVQLKAAHSELQAALDTKAGTFT